MKEPESQFDLRKKDHIRLALDSKTQALGLSGLDQIELIHEALPELNLSEVTSKISFIGSRDQKEIFLNSPIYISSMTAGHLQGIEINKNLAQLSAQKRILMGVGSQRKELANSEADGEWKKIRVQAPGALLMANLGISQVISTPMDIIKRIVNNLEALALFVHLNPLQECLQPEGTPQFKGGLAVIEALVKELPVPVIIKEVGCGMSSKTLSRLNDTGVFAVDVSGLGGTHWGRIEGFRSAEESRYYKVADNFSNWGISTTQSVLNAVSINPQFQVWASGGVRSGVDVAKLLAMGVTQVGVAQPFLVAAMATDPEKQLNEVYGQFEEELRIALFCTGCRDVKTLRSSKVWKLRS